MSVWIVIAAMTAAAAAILLWPLIRKAHGETRRARYDLAVYRDQLAELARDEARATLGAEEAAAARLEIERRILAADSGTPLLQSHRGSKAARIAVALAAIAGPLAAIALYLNQGTPGMNGEPFAERAQEAQAQGKAPAPDMAKIDAMVAKLAKQLEAKPDDLQGWMLLARSYMVMQRYDEAASAYAHAAALEPKNATWPSSRGEALIYAADGTVTPKARDAFESALAVDPSDTRARFYLGLAAAQAGELRAALAAWEALAADAPKDAPWLPQLNTQIAKLKQSIESEPKDAAPDKAPAKKDASKSAAPKTDEAGKTEPENSGPEKTEPEKSGPAN